MFFKKNNPDEEIRRTIEGHHITSIDSFINNQMLLEQGVAEKTADYNYYNNIHRLLQIREVVDEGCCLARLGRRNDGGYVVLYGGRENSYSEDKVAYSLGISDDVSFDIDLANSGYELYQYDHTIDSLPENHKQFHWKKIGVSGENETAQLKSLESLIKLNGHEKRRGMLLKADIEGSEWDMISDCSHETLFQFDQIVIEYHNLLDYDMREKIIRVLEKMSQSHQVVHIHGNNNSYVNYSGKLITPNVIEVTYVLKEKYHFADVNIALPIDLDQPCRVNANEILLGNWNCY